MKKTKLTIFIAIMLIPLSIFAFSSGADNFKWTTKTDGSKIEAIVTIPEGYYLYSEFTTVELKNENGKALKAENTPKAIEHTDDFGTKLFIYPEGIHKWSFTAPESGNYKFDIKFQGCSKKPFACYPPKDYSKTIAIQSVGQANTVTKTTSKNELTLSTEKGTQSITQIEQNNMHDTYLGSLIKKGGIWIFIVALLGGLFSVFTPCVLPLLPITIAILGAGKDAKKSQAFKRSFLYVAGIVITFTSLAVFASITGRAFGSALLSNPTVLLVFSLFFIFMSFSLLGMYDLQLPNSWSNALNKFGGGTDAGAFFMGLVAGFIAIPCTGPILATLLGISAASGSVFFGGALLFVYALGFGIPFFIVGIGLVKAPKSGSYMDIVKSFLGVVILILSIYIITIAIPSVNNFLSAPSNTFKAVALLLIIIGVLFGAFHADGHSIKKSVKYLKITGAIIAALGIVWILKMPVGNPEHKLQWNTNLEQSFSVAKENNKPIVLDFTAEWCTACKELEAMTFSDKMISKELKDNWTLTKVDATRDSKELRTVLEKYNVKGFPTVIFFTPEGKEFGRFSGFLPPDKFSKYLKQYKN
jgi:thioredoxin:protein disulfide reductase